LQPYLNNNNNNNNNNNISYTRKTFDRFTTEDWYTWKIKHNKESTAVLNLKPERWGSLLVQDSTRKKRRVTRDDNNNNNNNNNNVTLKKVNII
jgi:uncharacterized membrane protein YkoI